MDSCADNFQFPVQLAGSVASRILNTMAHGRVAALFNSSFYIETEAGFVCIGNEDLGASPLNLVTMAPAGTNWPASGLRLNEKVSVGAGTLRVGNRLSFLMSDTCTWSPGGVSGWNIIDLERGIKSFREASARLVAADGLGSFLIPGFQPSHEHRVCTAAKRPMDELRLWLIAAVRNPDKRIKLDTKSVQPLIGLGPGLTPSGDDFIGGMMIALHALGETGLCRHLSECVLRGAENASNPISCAHLEAASHGEGSAGIHRALGAILKGCPASIENCLSGIDCIGHTSGWDIMAGVIIALEAWLQAGYFHDGS